MLLGRKWHLSKATQRVDLRHLFFRSLMRAALIGTFVEISLTGRGEVSLFFLLPLQVPLQIE